MMNEADSYDPYLKNADLIGAQMIAEVEEDIPWLDVAARQAQFEFRITINGATRPVVQRLPVLALARADVLEESLAPVLQWTGPFVVEVWVAPDSVPAVWVELGLTQGAEIAGIKGADLKAVLVAALRAIWDTSVTADFLGFELYKRARGGLQVPTTGRSAQKNMLMGLYSRHLEKAAEALSKGDRRAAAGFTTAAAGCLGVPRQAVLGLTATTKYRLNTRSRGQSRPPSAIPGDLQRLLDQFSASELQQQDDLIAQAAGRLVEEGRAAWCERQFFILQQAGFPFLRSVPRPIEIQGYGTQVYRDGMELIESAASRTSRWVFLSPFLMEQLILSAWAWLLAVAPPHLLEGLATEARVLPEYSVKAIADWEADDRHWARHLAEYDDLSNQRAAEVAKSLL